MGLCFVPGAGLGVKKDSRGGCTAVERLNRRNVFAPSRVVVRRTGREEVKCSMMMGGLVQAGSTVAGLAVLAVTILVHETGHYLAARSRGIQVQNFSVGFGPKLWSYTRKGSTTEFCLRAIPLGGFVSFPPAIRVDEDTGETIELEDPDLLSNRPVADRALVVSAGVIANLILAWSALFVSVTAAGVPTIHFEPGVIVSQLTDVQGNGAKAGILPGDIILAVNGNEVEANSKSAAFVASSIRSSEGEPLTFHMRRDDKVFDMEVKPKCCSPAGESILGIQLSARGNVSREKPTYIGQAISLTNREFNRLGQQTLAGLKRIVTNFGEHAAHVSGPIGVVSMGAELARNDRAALLTFCADISMNLAIMNSLPLPALDGGQMIFLIAEAARGSPVSTRIQDTVNRTAILMFLTFSGFLMFGDISKLKFIQSLSQLLG